MTPPLEPSPDEYVHTLELPSDTTVCWNNERLSISCSEAAAYEFTGGASIDMPLRKFARIYAKISKTPALHAMFSVLASLKDPQ